MKILNLKKVLFGLSVSLVLAMAIGSFAIGEVQTPVTPQATAQNEAVSTTYDDFEVSGDTSTILFSNSVLTISGGEHTISMVQGVESTSDRINVTGSATITLEGVNISTGSGSAMTIDDSANVTVLLADGSTNILTTTASYNAGLRKADGGNTLTIGVPIGSQGDGILKATGGNYTAGIGGCRFENGTGITITGGTVIATGGEYGAGIGGGDGESGSNITITGGNVTATGGYSGAGIGGGQNGNGSYITITGGHVIAYGGSFGAGIGGGILKNGSDITISGGVVEAYGGKYLSQSAAPSGIGGGADGSATGNSISGNAVVMATSGLEGVEALPNCTIDNGIVFKGYGDDFDTDHGRATDFVWDVSGNAYGYVEISENETFPTSLTITTGSKLTVGSEANITLASGANITVADGAELANDGTIPDDGTVVCDGTGTGKVTIKTDFYRNGSTEVYKTGYQTYQTKAGVQKYKDLPNPDDTTLLKNSLNSDKFLYWYYLDKDGKEVAIKDGDSGDDVLPNQHKFYEKRATSYAVTIPTLENGSVTSDVTEAYSGDTVTLTVTPKEGYEPKEGSVKVTDKDGNEIQVTEKDGKYTFEMPDSEVTISAIFEKIPEPTPTPPGPEPEPTPEPTPDPSVNPDGDGSGASSKTSDPFMGGVALALLGVATTGAVLVRKRK